MTPAVCTANQVGHLRRSAAIVLAYLLVREQMALLDAWRLVRGKRKVARPNSGFAAQLIELESESVRAGWLAG